MYTKEVFQLCSFFSILIHKTNFRTIRSDMKKRKLWWISFINIIYHFLLWFHEKEKKNKAWTKQTSKGRLASAQRIDLTNISLFHMCAYLYLHNNKQWNIDLLWLIRIVCTALNYSSRCFHLRAPFQATKKYLRTSSTFFISEHTCSTRF